MSSQVDKWIEKLKNCKYLAESELKMLCEMCKNILVEQSNVERISAPVTVCGDIHGQFHDLLTLFETGGQVPETSYIFMGDFVDRGYHSLETFSYMMALKVRYPTRVSLLRGNHESRLVTMTYGFYDECHNKYGSNIIWKCCTQVFDLLSISALIDNSVFCVHGGLSPKVNNLDQIRLIERKNEIPHEGAFCDLVWSDPEEDISSWAVSSRGAGWLFGPQVTFEFAAVNDIDLICRAHQLVQDGYKYHFHNKLVTVWSAPNYCYRCGNCASVLKFDADLARTFLIFEQQNRVEFDEYLKYQNSSFFI